MSTGKLLQRPFKTILRKNGKADAYEQLKALTRGKKINQKLISEFVSGLAIPTEDKETLLSLTPESYIGIAPQLAEML